MLNPLVLSRRVALVLGGASVFALASPVALAASPAAGSSQTSAINAQYQREVARCKSGQTNEDPATCLKEAGAARQQALQGGLDNQPGVNQNYSQNALDRCKLVPAAQRKDCMALMQDPSQTEGSVGSGGVLRKYEYQVPVQPSQTDNQSVPVPAAPPAQQ
jgi:hypothetical protein